MEKLINIFQVIKNRSRVELDDGQNLFLYPNCIDSIIESIKGSNLKYKLYVCDFESDDYPLKDWFPQKLNDIIDYEIITVKNDFFDKGLALNLSREIFKDDDFIFYLDVDNIITSKTIEILEYRFSSQNSVGFFAPIFLNSDGSGNQLLESVGSLWIKHCDLVKIPPWINMNCWGGEDTIFLYNCLKSGLRVCRETNGNIFHQWHPVSLRNKYYKGGSPPLDKYAQAIRNYYETGELL